MEKMEVDHAETILKQQQRFNQEQAAYQQRLEDNENEKQILEAELEKIKDKLERSKLDELKESEDVVQELRNLHEREKSLLMEENSKLSVELERSLEISTRLQADRRHLEDEFADLQGKKETVAQWEQQIGEIIQWVSDEKDARGCLQALAGKLTEEMEILKDKLCAFFKYKLDGSKFYIGRSMTEVHKNLGISDELFDKMTAIFLDSLRKKEHKNHEVSSYALKYLAATAYPKNYLQHN